MFINNFDPVAFNLFFIEVRWYSLSYIFGIIIGWAYIKKISDKNSKIYNLFDDYITYIVIGIIVGGRLGYILFYNLNYFTNNPIEILYIWNGGMSFHGGILGLVLFTYLYSLKTKIRLFKILDLVALSAPIGIFLGRISNFLNSELYGKPTDVFWSVKFIKVDELNRHPSQLYEAFFEGIILFLILNIFFKYLLNKPGVISGIFLIFYSIFRFFIEYLREPDPHIGYIFLNLTTGQIISLVTICFGIALTYYQNEKIH